MTLTRDEAFERLRSWTTSEALMTHARSVEIVMRAAAHRYGRGEVDELRFGLAGLLHDADYDRWPEEHPERIVQWLGERGEPELAHAVSAHYSKWGVSCESLLDRTLLACDELTGFVGACCLVRPEGIATLTPKSVMKKLKQKSFAQGVDRGEVALGVELLEVGLAEHVQFIIDALTPHARELGLTPG